MRLDFGSWGWVTLAASLLACSSANQVGPGAGTGGTAGSAQPSPAQAGAQANGAASDGGVGTSSAQGHGGASGAASSAGSDAGIAADGGARGDAARASSTSTPDLLALGTLPGCGGTLTALFSKSAIQPPATGSGIYNAAEPELRAALERSIRALVGGDVQVASSEAATAGYALCRTDDGGSVVVVVRPRVAGQGHAVMAWRPRADKALIIEAPHAFHDVDTELEAPEMFSALGAHVLILSGIYRCASLQAGPCDGYTTACTAVPSPYTISDAAHNSEMFFQAAHVAFAEAFATDFVTSLHGMPDPGISVSNGTQLSPAADSFQVRLLRELSAAFPSEQITTCQVVSGATQNKRWCGSENVQGRAVNGAPDVCAGNATVPSNRFVHVEQSRSVRTQRAQVIAAFGKALGG